MSEENKEVGYQDKQGFWEPHIRGWKESGISQADYCRSQGLNISERLPMADVETDYKALLPQHVDRDSINNMKF